MNCQQCKFFLATDASQGVCRRFPPTPIRYDDGFVYSNFPVMLNEGWCGELNLKPESD